MMKYLYSISFCFFIQLAVYSQQSSSQNIETQAQQKHLKETITVLKIDVSTYPPKKINSLKLEAESWQEKVLSVTIDTQTMTMSIEHNALLLPLEINEILDRQGISKDKIISDK